MKKIYLFLSLFLALIIGVYLFFDKNEEVILHSKKKIENTLSLDQVKIEQSSVFNPQGEVIYLDTSKREDFPSIPPKDNVIHNWFASKKFDYSTNDYKPYIFNAMPFRMAYPRDYNKGKKKYPIVFILHGKGEKGEPYDNESQLFNGGKVHLIALKQKKFDGFIVYPQIPGSWYEPRYETLNLLIKALVDSLDIDINRVVFHGLSAGGNGVIEMARKYPKIISTVLPMSAVGGWGDMETLRYIPMWVFQGKRDVLPSHTYTEYEVNRLIDAGGEVKYTLYPKLGHNVWDTAYSEETFFEYLSLSHKANPVAYKGKTSFKNEPIHTTLGLTPGFEKYEWRFNGEVLSSESSHTLKVTKSGKYEARILDRGEWSDWSLRPIFITQ